jgi:hypothetical protein
MTPHPDPLDQAETVQQDRSTPDLPVLYASILGKQGSRIDTDRRISRVGRNQRS